MGEPSSPAADPRPRLWPGVVIVALQWLVILAPAWVAPLTMAHFFGWFLGPMIGAAAVAVWWLFASRLSWADRWAVPLACAAAAAAVWFLRDPSMNAGGLVIYALPIATTTWVAWLVLTPLLGWPARRAGLLAVVVLAWAWFPLVRFEGTTGDISATLRPRWSPTAEDQFLAELNAGKVGGVSAGATEGTPTLAPGDWPAFRGPDRDGRLAGVRIATDWTEHPPRQLWRHRVGPGWSSFAVVGHRLYTQEQRGADEAVICYHADTGSELWAHKDATRFNEAMGGPGPRATPTFHAGNIYAQGANGRLNCLDAATGRLVWSRDVAADSGAKVQAWGFAASPLVTQGVVSTYAGAPDGKSVAAYRADTGEPAWSGGEGLYSYCSPQLARVAGVEQIIITTAAGLSALSPTTGQVLWRHDWPLPGEMSRVVQPTQVGESDFLLGTGFGYGLRRVHVDREGDRWRTHEVWTTKAIKPYFNDLVIHGNHLYGFDNNFFTCVSLEDGKAKWRARGYGTGQVLLLADQGLLLILAEQGAAALVEATPEGHRELGRFQAIEGKTWNHPVVARGKLFVRNGEEAACYELTPAGAVAAAGFRTAVPHR